MSDCSNFNISGTVNCLLETAGNIAKIPVDLLNNGINTAVSIIQPATKTAADLAVSVLNTFSQVLQNIASVIAPKN
ncbi:MAG: chlorosome envelope protein B [Chlorobiaceae bacterium]|nr:chlorosome envelope protein B [Chlorobiaceae bacterium]